MNDSYFEDNEKELENIKLKSFEELERQCFNDIKLEDFQNKHLKEFNDVELREFKAYKKQSIRKFIGFSMRQKSTIFDSFLCSKNRRFLRGFIEDSKTDRSIENLKMELNSKDAIKNIIKELQDIGINGKLHLKLLRMLKREVQK